MAIDPRNSILISDNNHILSDREEDGTFIFDEILSDYDCRYHDQVNLRHAIRRADCILFAASELNQHVQVIDLILFTYIRHVFKLTIADVGWWPSSQSFNPLYNWRHI